MSVDAERAEPFGPKRATFIVRLVHERTSEAAWRGEIEYVQGGERRLAAGAEGVLAQLTAWLTALDDAEAAQRR